MDDTHLDRVQDLARPLAQLNRQGRPRPEAVSQEQAHAPRGNVPDCARPAGLQEAAGRAASNSHFTGYAYESAALREKFSDDVRTERDRVTELGQGLVSALKTAVESASTREAEAV